MDSICGIDCSNCELKDTCSGCSKTNGHPFGGECVIAMCCQHKGNEHCDKCSNSFNLKEQLIAEFNELNICDMEKVTDLNALLGSFVNVEFSFSNGQNVKLLDDNKIYLGNQLCKKNSDRCYGLAADKEHLLVCEYSVNGADPEIIVYKKR